MKAGSTYENQTHFSWLKAKYPIIRLKCHMVERVGLEPTTLECKSNVFPIKTITPYLLEIEVGIEPT